MAPEATLSRVEAPAAPVTYEAVPDQPAWPISALVRIRTFEAFRFREFRYLWLSQLGTAVGYWMDQVTRGWLMYDLTGSALQLGLVTAVQVLPLLLLSPIAGTAADRFGRKRQAVVAQSLAVLPIAALAVLVFAGLVAPWHLYVAGLFLSITQVMQNPARASMLPDAVDRSHITNAVGLHSIAFNSSRTIGPALAGGLIALFGAGNAYVVQCIMAGLTAFWTMQVRLPDRGAANGKAHERSFLGSIVAGWQYMLQHPTIRTVMLLSLLAQFFGMSFTTLLPVFARDVLDVGAAGQGLLLTGQGVGALGSALLLASFGDKLPKGKLMVAGMTLYGLLELAFSQSPWLVVSVVLMTALGVCHLSANALVQSVVQMHAAPEMRGRVMAAFQQKELSLVLGGLMAGAAGAALGAPLTVALMGAACVLCVLTIVVTMPHIRDVR